MTGAVRTMTAGTLEHRTEGRAALAPAGIVGGVGGLVFAVTVVVQNILRATDLPANNASASSVSAYYGGHHATSVVLAALYPLGALGLAAFVGALLSKLWFPAVRAPAVAGALGAAGIVAMYTMTLATDTALAQYVHRGHPAGDVVSAMWITHNAVFGVLLVSIGIALAGLSAAGAAAGIVPAGWKRVGPAGALALLVAGGCAPALVDGSKVLVVGLVGFIVWLVFVASAAVALLRGRGALDT